MLKQMRDVGKSLHWILLLVIASFVLGTIFWQWGMGGSSMTGPRDEWAAKVGSDVVTAREFYDRYESRESELRGQYGAQFDRRFMNADALLGELIDAAVLRREAERMGLVVSPHEIADILRKEAIFQGPGGGFDPELYEKFLEASGRSTVDLEKSISDQLLAGKVERVLRGAVAVPASAVKQAWLDRNETVTFEYVLFPVEEYLAGVSPTEEDLRAHFDANPDDYDAGPAREVRWASFDREIYQAALEDEKEMREYYEKNLATHYTMGADQRRARRLLVVPEGSDEEARAAARADAEGLAARARAGEDFEKLVREHSDDESLRESGGDTGPFYQGLHDPAFDQAAFSMTAGEIRGPIETGGGFEVIQLTKGEGEATRPFEEVRAMVSRGLYAARAAEEADLALEKFQKEHAKDEDFDDAAKAAGAKVVGPRWVTRGETVEELGPNPALTAAVFELKKGGISEPLPAEGGHVIFVVEDERETTQRTFEEARDAVDADVRREHAMELARASARTVLDATKGGKALADAAAPRVVATAGPGTRKGALGALGASTEVADAAFATPVGELGPVADSALGPIVFRVNERVEFDPAKFETEAPLMRQALELRAWLDFRRAALDRLREGYEGGITVNEQVLAPLRMRS